MSASNPEHAMASTDDLGDPRLGGPHGEEGGTTSPWMDVEIAVGEGPGEKTITDADVCIVGAGIAGLTTAYMLATEGHHVVVVDDGGVGGGETARTTAHLASYLDDRFTVLERVHGAEGARLAAESHATAIEVIERIVTKEGIDCDFRRVDGYLFRGADRPSEDLDEELGASIRAGHISAEIVARVPVPGWDSGPAIRFPQQAQFHPLAYMRGLLHAFEKLGGRVFTGVHVDRIERPDSPGDGEPLAVIGRNGVTVRAKHVVVATNGPINSLVALPLKQAAYRTYAVALVVPRGVVPTALYWDTEDPYHYVRITPGSEKQTTDLLVVGGEDHKTGQPGAEGEDEGARFRRLEAWARARFSGISAVVARWSGQVLEPADGLAFIGPVPGGPGNVHVITGDSGHGMTHGTIGGLILTDTIAGRVNRWAHLYDPSRISLRSVGDMISENTNTFAQYGDWLRSGDVTDVRDIPPGEGAIVRRGLHLLAVHRDAGGELVELSATCRHLGGVVRWNAVEKSWDCPCHGARYDARGKVICGPASRDLEAAPRSETPEPPADRDPPASSDSLSAS